MKYKILVFTVFTVTLSALTYFGICGWIVGILGFARLLGSLLLAIDAWVCALNSALFT